MNQLGVTEKIDISGEHIEVAGPQRFRLFCIADIDTRLARELDMKERRGTPIDPVPFVIADKVAIDFRTPILDVFAFFRPKGVAHVLGNVMNVGLRVEAGSGAEAVAAAGAVQVGVNRMAILGEIKFEGGTGLIGAVQVRRRTCDPLKAADDVFAEADTAVDSTTAVEGAIELAIGVNEPQSGVPEHVA